MAGTTDTLRDSESVPDSRKRRAVLAKHPHPDKRKALREVGKKLKKKGK